MYRSFCNKRPGSRNIKRWLLVKQNRLSYASEDARVWPHWNHSFYTHLSYLGPVSCVFSSWVSSGYTIWGGCSSWLLDGRHSLFPSWVPSGLTARAAVMWCLKKSQLCVLTGLVAPGSIRSGACLCFSYIWTFAGLKWSPGWRLSKGFKEKCTNHSCLKQGRSDGVSSRQTEKLGRKIIHGGIKALKSF